MATTWLSKTLVPSGVVEHVVCGSFVPALSGQAAQVVLLHAGSSLEMLAIGASGAAASICSQPLQTGDAVVDMRVLKSTSEPGPSTRGVGIAASSGRHPDPDSLLLLSDVGRLTVLRFDEGCNRFILVQEVQLVGPGTQPRFMPRLLAASPSGRFGVAVAAFQDRILYLPPASASTSAPSPAPPTAAPGSAAAASPAAAAAAAAAGGAAWAEGSAAFSMNKVYDWFGGGVRHLAVLADEPVPYTHRRPRGDAATPPPLTAGPVAGAAPRDLLRATAEALEASDPRVVTSSTYLPLPLEPGCGAVWDLAMLEAPCLASACGGGGAIGSDGGGGGGAGGAGGGGFRVAALVHRSSTDSGELLLLRWTRGSPDLLQCDLVVRLGAGGPSAGPSAAATRGSWQGGPDGLGATGMALETHGGGMWGAGGALPSPPMWLLESAAGWTPGAAAAAAEDGLRRRRRRPLLGTPHLLRATPPDRNDEDAGLLVVGTHGALFLMASLLARHALPAGHGSCSSGTAAAFLPSHDPAASLAPVPASLGPSIAPAGLAIAAAAGASAGRHPAATAAELPHPPPPAAGPPVLYLEDLVAAAAASPAGPASKGAAAAAEGEQLLRGGDSSGSSGGGSGDDSDSDGLGGGGGGGSGRLRGFGGWPGLGLGLRGAQLEGRHHAHQHRQQQSTPAEATAGPGWAYLRLAETHFAAAAAGDAAAGMAAGGGDDDGEEAAGSDGRPWGRRARAGARSAPAAAAGARRRRISAAYGSGAGGDAAAAAADVMDVDDFRPDGASSAAGADGRRAGGSDLDGDGGGGGGDEVGWSTLDDDDEEEEDGGAAASVAVSMRTRAPRRSDSRQLYDELYDELREEVDRMASMLELYRAAPDRPGAAAHDDAGEEAAAAAGGSGSGTGVPGRGGRPLLGWRARLPRGRQERTPPPPSPPRRQPPPPPLQAPQPESGVMRWLAQQKRRGMRRALLGEGVQAQARAPLQSRRAAAAGAGTAAAVRELLVPLLEEHHIQGARRLKPLKQAPPVLGVERLPLPESQYEGHILTAAEWLPPTLPPPPPLHSPGGPGPAPAASRLGPAAAAAAAAAASTHGSASPRRLLVCSAAGPALYITVSVSRAAAARLPATAAAVAAAGAAAPAAPDGGGVGVGVGFGAAAVEGPRPAVSDCSLDDAVAVACAGAGGSGSGGPAPGLAPEFNTASDDANVAEEEGEQELPVVRIDVTACLMPGGGGAAAAAVSGLTAAGGRGTAVRPARAVAVLPYSSGGVLVWSEEGGDVLIMRHRPLQSPPPSLQVQQQQQQHGAGLQRARLQPRPAALPRPAAPQPPRSLLRGSAFAAQAAVGYRADAAGGGGGSAAAATAMDAARSSSTNLKTAPTDAAAAGPSAAGSSPQWRQQQVAGDPGLGGGASGSAGGSLGAAASRGAAAAALGRGRVPGRWAGAAAPAAGGGADAAAAAAAARTAAQAAAAAAPGALALRLLGRAPQPRPMVDFVVTEAAGVSGRGRLLQVTGAVLGLDTPEGGPPAAAREPKLQVLRGCLAAPVVARVPSQGATPTGMWSIPLRCPLTHNAGAAGGGAAGGAAGAAAAAAANPPPPPGSPLAGGSLVLLSFVGGSRALAPVLDTDFAAESGSGFGSGSGPGSRSRTSASATHPDVGAAAPSLRDVTDALQLRHWEPTVAAGLVAEGVLVQVTPSGILLASLDLLSSPGLPAAAAITATITAATRPSSGSVPPDDADGPSGGGGSGGGWDAPLPRSTWPSPKSSRFEDRNPAEQQLPPATASEGEAGAAAAGPRPPPPPPAAAPTASGGGGGSRGPSLSGYSSMAEGIGAMALASDMQVDDGETHGSVRGAAAATPLYPPPPPPPADDDDVVSQEPTSAAAAAAAGRLASGGGGGAAAPAPAEAEAEVWHGGAAWWSAAAADITLGAVAPGCVALVRRLDRRVTVRGWGGVGLGWVRFQMSGRSSHCVMIQLKSRNSGVALWAAGGWVCGRVEGRTDSPGSWVDEFGGGPGAGVSIGTRHGTPTTRLFCWREGRTTRK
ncbi:hypothetical protein PLESTF_000891700 [Pleodorina starrii]|nr:hypothetical protein PLESTF_000891700 [Pleodorina starrii]